MDQRDQGFEGEVLMVPSADMRYRGQSYEIDTRLRHPGLSQVP